MIMSNNLSKLKLLLNLNSEADDEKLALVLEMIQSQVMGYLNKLGKEPPMGLDQVILQITVDYLKQDNMGIEAIETNTIKSIKRGDTQTTYNIADVQSCQAFISLYSDLLRPFMKVVMH